MLAQNTDRMWVVIVAVIVGAALIFIANGTLPTLFASVSDSFEESADKGSEVVAGISPNIGINNLYNEDTVVVETLGNSRVSYIRNDMNGFTITSSSATDERIKLRLNNIIPTSGQYLVQFDIRTSKPNTRLAVDIGDVNDINQYSTWDDVPKVSTQWQAFRMSSMLDNIVRQDGTNVLMNFVDINIMVAPGATVEIQQLKVY